MTIRAPKAQGMSMLTWVKWSIQTVEDELISIERRKEKIPDFPENKIKRMRQNAIDHCIRAQYYFGWSKGAISSCAGSLYREASIHPLFEEYLCPSGQIQNYKKKLNETPITIEHVIPVSSLRDEYLKEMNAPEGIEQLTDRLLKARGKLIDAMLGPVALITQDAEKRITGISANDNHMQPFQRYAGCSMQVVTHEGVEIGGDWCMDDHWALIARASDNQDGERKLQEIRTFDWTNL